MGVTPRRALISVHDKDGVVELARALVALGFDLISSGGTASLLESSGLAVRRVADETGFPEMLDGRVKTLHPRIHAGILAVRDNARHMEDLERSSIRPIDLVIVNLYPFERTAAIDGIGRAEVIEMIDVGGPALLRAAAKNSAHVGVVVDAADYPRVLAELEAAGELSADLRAELAVKAFRHTASYDGAVAAYLARQPAAGAEPGAAPFPERLQLDFIKAEDLRYGENPHQRAAFYREPAQGGPGIGRARQLQGKPLSFNNILDLAAALDLVGELPSGAAAILKHGNPCGVGLGADPLAAFQRALQCDPLSAFGGVIAFNRNLDRRAAEAIAEQFYEAVLAPDFDAEAREVLARRTGLRLLATGEMTERQRAGYDLRRVAGGLLAQDWDPPAAGVRAARVVTRRAPTSEEWEALELAWTVVKHVKSNAIVYARADRTVGIGAGQMSRVDAARFAALKAQSPLEGAAMASDAFFPFRDGLDLAAENGVSAVVQPGGSIRDAEVVAAADEHGMAMVLTGRRHFRH